MNIQRRNFIKSISALSLSGAFHPGFIKGKNAGTSVITEKLINAVSQPVLKTKYFPSKVKIDSIELLKNGREYIVRVRSSDGAVGIAVSHRTVMSSTFPMLLHRVLPFFKGKDARDLDKLIEGVYLRGSNYKWQGLPFWVCVASIEMAILDLLGRIANKPVGELLGNILRKDMAVYRASGHRGNTPEEEVKYLQKLVEETGAKAVKFRLGGRMMYNENTTRRDKGLIPLARKVLEDKITLYVDGNGSYDVPMAIEIGKILEEYNVAFFEEPCPFDYYEETKKVADALTIPIAGGEEESSIRTFRRMIENNVLQVVQPDLFYFGGFIRSIRVARMAKAAGLICTPHMSGGGWGFLYLLHFASCVPNIGPHQEYKGNNNKIPVTCDTSSLKSVDGIIKIPTGPGWGVNIDPDFIRKAKVITI